MAHFAFNDGTKYGGFLRRFLMGTEAMLDDGADVLATMAAMLTGDGSQESHFTVIVTHYGFTSNANAKAAYEELLSAYAKVSGDASVSNVHAALTQMIARLR